MYNTTDVVKRIDGRQLTIGDIITYDESTKIVKLNADIFIIPNSACTLKGYREYARPDRKNWAEQITSINGDIFSEDSDYFIETWVTSGVDGQFGDNFCDHSYSFTDGTHEYHFGYLGRDILSNFLIGYSEGDTRTFRFPHYINIDGVNVDVIVEANYTLNQSDYRYSRFGDFEDVLSQVMA